MAFQTILFAAVAILFFAIKFFNRTDIPKIKGLPEIPGVPLFGSLISLGNSHPRNAGRLAKKYGAVFQVRLGNRRVIIANSFDAVKELWISNSAALVSRPQFYTFHSIVSSSKGFTLGTSPWNESVKRARKAAATALNRESVKGYLPFIDLESTTSIKELLDNCKYGDIDPNGYFQRFSLNISLTLNYGIRIDGSVKNELLQEVVTVERELANMRGTGNNWQDYVPLLRWWPKYRRNAAEYRDRRDAYIEEFLRRLKQRIDDGTDNPCITGNVLKDPEAKLSPTELQSICLTMVAAGLDTLPGNINMTVAYLSSPHGQEIQQIAYDDIMKAHPDGDAWHKVIQEENSPYMVAFVKEVLRFWSTVNMGFTRQSIKDITYHGATIPAGTPFFMNAYASNHDDTHFKDPSRFMPERFLDISEGQGTVHYGYGAGARSCSGMHLANRELYAIFCRIILAFHIKPTSDLSAAPILDPIECNSVMTSMVTQPKPFKVGYVPRDLGMVERWVGESLERTSYL